MATFGKRPFGKRTDSPRPAAPEAGNIRAIIPTKAEMDQIAEAVASLIGRLSLEDVSMLEVALKQEEPAVLMTSANSTNDVFWAKLVDFGFMQRETNPAPDFPNGRSYSLIAEKKEIFRELFLDGIQEQYSTRAMTRIVNELCVPFVTALRKHIEAGGGNDTDLITILGIINVHAIRASSALDQYAERMNSVYKVARDIFQHKRPG